ncbi:MAG: DUF5946 family protein [Streptosporangiaceae bacterium]
MTLKPCPECGALLADVAGPVHAYVPGSPGCWLTFTQLGADEAVRFGYVPARQLRVDAYMAQHPGPGTDRRQRQSVFVHLVSLAAVLEGGMAPERAPQLLQRAVISRRDFPPLERAEGPGTVTVLHLVGASDLADYDRRGREWADAVWQSWASYHELIRDALNALRR